MLPIAYAPFAAFPLASAFVNDTGLLPESPVSNARIRVLCSFDIAIGPEFGQRRHVIHHGMGSVLRHIYIVKKRYSIISKNEEKGTERRYFFEILYGILTVYICSNNKLRGERKKWKKTH